MIKLEVTFDVIVHATEDLSKIFQSFEEIFEIKEEEFAIKNTNGYFENPIIILNIKMIKKQAQKFISRLLELLTDGQLEQLISEIEERTVDSRLHLRLDKQEFIKGKLSFQEKDAIKLKIHTPIYNKKDTIKVFTKVFQIAN